MGDKSGINWTDATWNPVTGCDKVSPGCDHCYALTMAKRLKGMGVANYQTDGNPETSGPGFGYAEHPHMLDRPLRWTRGRRIFVNSMSDLFHQDATRAFQAQVWAVMALAEQHTFQVLTKRPGVMRSRLSDPTFRADVANYAQQIALGGHPAIGSVKTRAVRLEDWPLPNVWVGTSVEDQKRADLRVPQLLDTPAIHRFLSMEPLLGPVDLRGALGFDYDDQGTGERVRVLPVNWVIVGGESGRGARVMDLDWVRSLRDQCTAAHVAFWYKQQGTGDGGEQHRRELDGRTWDEWPA